MRYLVNTDSDRREMLAEIGVESIDDLFSDIPEEVKARFRPLGLSSKSELEVRGTVERFASNNADPNEVISFLGGGMYDHYIPSVVAHVLSRSEFYTAYTPYQPEISQGTLTAMFEFQTLVCELFGMEVANASMYDGGSALAEAVLMAERVAGKGRIGISRALFPHYRRVVETYAWAADLELIEVPYLTPEGRIDRSAIPSGLSGLVVQSPNAFGVIEDLTGLKNKVRDGLLIVATNPIAMGIIAPPGEFGADIVTAEGQPLGIPPSFGGPGLGLFATRMRYIRTMPGRIAGRTVDAAGNPGYTMTLQTREQHIRRARATSNICTNAQLSALAATVYLATLGADGLAQVARLNLAKAHYLAGRIAELPGYALAFTGPFFNEFVVRIPGDPETIRARLLSAGVAVSDPGWLSALGVEGAIAFAVTERRSREELDRVVDALREAGE